MLFFIFYIILNILLFLAYKPISEKINIFDEPDNIRKKHKNRTPLIGGVYLFINVLTIILMQILGHLNNIYFFNFFTSFYDLLSFFIITFGFFIIGFFDDKYDLSPIFRLVSISLIYLVGSIINEEILISELKFSFLDEIISLGIYKYFFSILCILLLVNAINLFDGINLQTTIFSFSVIIFLMFNSIYLNILIVISISLIVVMYLNYKDKIFLGDSGVYLLGGLIIMLIIKNYNYNLNIDADLIFILLMVPGLDMIRIYFSRLFSGKKIFSSDRNHIHHLLLNKFGYNITISLIALICFLPLLLISFFNSIYIGIIVTLFYIFLLYISKYNLKGFQKIE